MTRIIKRNGRGHKAYPRNKKRSREYEQKFRAYLFGFDFETHKEICKNLNVKPAIIKGDGE